MAVSIFASDNSVGFTIGVFLPHSEYGYLAPFPLQFISYSDMARLWRIILLAARPNGIVILRHISAYLIHRAWRSAPMDIVISIFMCADIPPFGLIDRCYC